MPLFRKNQMPLPIPAPFTAQDIRIEASICTGERTIGFYDKGSGKLLYAEFVRSEDDIRRFYHRYGLEPEA